MATAQPQTGPTPLPALYPQAEEMLQILSELQAGERFLVCSHSRPDGDAVGSMLAMGMILQAMGKTVDLVSADRIPPIYRSLPDADRIRTAMRVHGPYDAVVLLECDGVSRTRLRGLEAFRLINIDHHISGNPYGALNWIDRSAVSVGELVQRIGAAAGVPLTPAMATCLYTTLLTDTGCFCYGALTERSFELARVLVAAGADPVAVARDVYFSTPASKLKLLGAALSHLHQEGRLAWLWVTEAEMVQAGASEEDCEGVVNYAVGIAGVEAAVFLRELPEGRIRLSLRSKGRISVARLAEQLGGGGHENAAGTTLDGPIERATEEILCALREFMTAPGN